MAFARHPAAPLALALSLAVAGPLALSARSPEVGAPALLVTAPWSDADAAARAANGAVIALRKAPMATLAVFPDEAAIRAARSAGWFLVDGATLAALCGVNS
jgi:hypothetical protein